MIVADAMSITEQEAWATRDGHGAKIVVPAFVVTLAGLLGWQGAQLAVLGSTGSVNLPDSIITVSPSCTMEAASAAIFFLRL